MPNDKTAKVVARMQARWSKEYERFDQLSESTKKQRVANGLPIADPRKPQPPEPEKPPRPVPFAFAYTRVSTNHQAETKLSTTENTRIAVAHAKARDLNLGDRVYIDAASAYKVPFEKRPAAKELLNQIRPYDHLIITKGDRAFRSMLECLNVIHDLHRRNIVVHMLDAPVDITTDVGQLILAVMAWCAQWESKRKSERMYDAHRSAILMGRPMRKHPPIGFRWVGSKLSRRLRLSEEARAIMKEMYVLRHNQRKTIEWIRINLRDRGIMLPHRTPPTEFTYPMVQKYLNREAEFRRIENLSEEPLTDEAVGKAWLVQHAEEIDRQRKIKELRRAGKLPKAKIGPPRKADRRNGFH